MGKSESLEEIHREIAECTNCDLYMSRKLTVPGEGPVDARVMFVGEAPGEKEDSEGRPFVGPSGRLFDKLLKKNGIDRAEVFITGVVKCRPPDNRNPQAHEIAACNTYLERQFDVIQPEVICALGSIALKTLLGPKASLNKVRGRPLLRNGITYYALYHPAAVFYRDELMEVLKKDMQGFAAFLQKMGLSRRGLPASAKAAEGFGTPHYAAEGRPFAGQE